MANALTYRINRNTVEISLWPAPQKSRVYGLLAAGLAVLMSVFAAWYTALQQPGVEALPGAVLVAIASALALRWLAPTLLWNRFGREVLHVDPVQLRIYHDYRLFRVLKVERRYQQLEAVIWTDLGRETAWFQRSSEHFDVRQREGCLLLKVDRERILSRVPMAVQDLEEAVLLLERFTQRRTGPGRGLFVVHNN